MSFSSSSVFDKITPLDNSRVETPSHSFSNSYLMKNNKTSSYDSIGIRNEYLSQMEASLLRASEPIQLNERHDIEVRGERGIWANRDEVLKWKGDIPISEYSINEDPQPKIIHKKNHQKIEYIQELAIRYLKPPSVPPPGDIIINQLPNEVSSPAPPIIIRQTPHRPTTPEPIVIREAPPTPPAPVSKKIITISGKRLPPPPRKVVIERLPQVPAKPQPVIIERWLPYTQMKRRVIFNRNLEPDPVVNKPRNVIIQWEAPQVTIHKQFKYLGIVRANPAEYIQQYGDTIVEAECLPDFVKEIAAPSGLVLASDVKESKKLVHELYGDVEALKYIDLDREGLGEYKYCNLDAKPPIYGEPRKPTRLLNHEAERKLIEVIENVLCQVSKNMNLMIDFEDTMKVINLINEKLDRKFSENEIRKILESLDLNNFITTGSVKLIDLKKVLLKYAASF
ncbi:hypothetical protein BpHYR1_033626 [Brachionus plicatilis]|uniref:Uncharacterized protein n=1 Tax=Brachionus plicatilis TaxID=10195 RepID=A0A3M7SYT3_BRAPC|nr:hypothetical protein BpHYR1_033626 [Brachionus plicatilis]